MKNLLKCAAVLALALVCTSVRALAITAPDSNGDIWTYVGTYQVNDGPEWTSNPPVYSGLEAASLLFGAPASGFEYAISIDDSLGFVTHTAHADQIYVGHVIVAEGFKVDAPPPGYSEGDTATSAYVRDNLSDNEDNHVWTRQARVPDAGSSLALLVTGLGAAGLFRRQVRR
jgi:VPDSG-CTERM motif